MSVGSAPTFALYLITDGAGEAMRLAVARALEGGPSGSIAVQLRAKSLDGRALTEEARKLLDITRKHHAPLFINDRIDVALAVGAEGVHLPVKGLPCAVARRLAPHLLLGASTHSLTEARAAVDGGADLLTFGPVYATPSKTALGSPVGVEALADVVRAIVVPVYALGGVTLENAAACRRVGARLACIRAVLAAPDPATAVAALIHC